MKPATLDAIYKSYFQDVYGYLFSLCPDHFLAEELVQETFFRAYLYLETCQADQVKPWLMKVAYNAFIDSQRKGQHFQTRDDTFFQQLTDFTTPEEDFIQREQFQEITQIIDSLPEKQKQAILLYDFRNLTYQEAAEQMHIRTGHFKVLLFRARQKIRQEKGRND